MRLPKFIRWIAFGLGGLIAIVLAILLILTFVQIPIDLTKHKGVVESAASFALGRDVEVDGRISLSTSLWPSFNLEGLRIVNPEGFRTRDFALMKNAKVQVGVLPLLARKIHIKEFSVNGLALTLEENKEGAVNWVFRPPKESVPEAPPKEKPPAQENQIQLTSDSLMLKKLVFEDISVSYRDADMAEPVEIKIDECTGSAPVGEPFGLTMKGTFLKHPFTTTVEGDSLQELLEQNRSSLQIKTEIAAARFELSGLLDLSQVNHTLEVKASVEGESLDSLNGLLGLDLPPLKSYEAGGQVKLKKGRLDLSDFEVRVGESKLVGKGAIENTGGRPNATLELAASTIQLNDFDVGEWSPERDESDAAVQKTPEPEESAKTAPEVGKATEAGSSDQGGGSVELLDPEFLGSFDAQMKVTAEKVLSGKDGLGTGHLTASLKQGRISLEPVKLNIPGGSLFFALSFKPGREASEASVRALMENFDFGVIARRAKPDTDMGGTLNLNVALKSSANNLDGLLASGNGYFDFSGQPENLHAGIIDLWAVNLIAAIVTKGDDKGSKINCLVFRLTMEDGVLTPDVFAIDTTKLRICGKGHVDFNEELVKLVVAPTAKKPQFFNLATPFEVRGTFDNFEMGIEPGGVVGTVFKFVTSPLHVPLRRMSGEGLPEDGGDLCGMTLGPNRPTEPPLGCRPPKKIEPP